MSVAVLVGEYLSNLFYLVLLLLPGLYWCFDPGIGLRAMLLTMLSAGLNTGLKVLFQVPRPLWGPALTGGGTGEQSYAFPSGHAEQIATAAGWIASKTRTLPVLAAAVALIITIGVARVLAQVHTPFQVIIGTLAGLVLVVVLLKFDRPLTDWLGERTGPEQVLLVTGSSLLLLGLLPACMVAGGLLILPGPLPPLTGPLDPAPHLIWTGLFFGIATGAVWTGRHRGFPPALTVREKVIRYIWANTGLLLIGLTFRELAVQVLPPLSWALVALGSVVCGWWITALVPSLCRRRGGWRQGRSSG